MANKNSFLGVERTARESFGLTLDDLCGGNHKSAYRMPRAIVFYLAHRYAGKGIYDIARRYNRSEVNVQRILHNLETKIKRDSLELKRFVKRLPKSKLAYFQNSEGQTEALKIPEIRVTALHGIPIRRRMAQQNSEKVSIVKTANGVRWIMSGS